MLIECLINRDEDVTVRDIHGFRYEFKVNEHGHKVCQVNSGEHRSMMLAFPASYKIYVPPLNFGPMGDAPTERFEVSDTTQPEKDDGDHPNPEEEEDEGQGQGQGKGIDEQSFVNQWLRMAKEPFLIYVRDNIEMFNICSLETRQRAINKWNKAHLPDAVIWPGRI